MVSVGKRIRRGTMNGKIGEGRVHWLNLDDEMMEPGAEIYGARRPTYDVRMAGTLAELGSGEPDQWRERRSGNGGRMIRGRSSLAAAAGPASATAGRPLPSASIPSCRKEFPVPVPLPEELIDLLRRPSLCFVATVMPDGSPQLTQTWVSTDGQNILINTPDWSQKARNVARDPRVALNIADPDNTRRYFAVRGHVIATTTEGGAQNIDEISEKYLGRPYPYFSGRPETRLIVTIEADSVRGMGAR